MKIIKNKFYLLLILCLLSQNILAGSFKTGNPERKKSNSEAFTEQIYKKMEKLALLVTEEKYSEARTGLNDILKRKLNTYEIAQVNQYIGWIDASEGKYVDAANRYQNALDSDSLPNQAHFGMMLQMAQMYMAGDQEQKALDMLYKYYAGVDEIDDKTFALEANIHYQMANYSKVIPVMIKAIGLSEKPQENWHYLLYGAYKQESKFREAVGVMEKLIQLNPNKKDYFTRLSQDYFNLKEDKKALAILSLADENGLVETEKEKLQLFQMYSYLEIPYNAGKVLEKGLRDGVIKPSFKRWEDLGKTWYAAAEMDNALEAYGEASKLSTDGKIDLYRSYIYLDKEDWPNLAMTVNTAIEKGGLDENDIGKVWMLLGTAEFEMKNNAKAIAAFRNAAKYPKSKSGAHQWLNHLQEAERIKRERRDVEIANEKERAANAVIDQ